MSSSEKFLKFLGHLSRRRSGGFCVECLSFLYGNESPSEIRDYLRGAHIARVSTANATTAIGSARSSGRSFL
jgi:hypothetical protein